MKTSLVPLLFVALSTLAPSIGTAQTARFDRTSLIIRDGKQQTTLEKMVDLPPISSVVHKVIKRGADYYVVVGLREWTQGEPQPRGSCGGGQEAYIEWLHVREGKIVEHQIGLYNSCSKNREGSVKGWQGSVLLWQSSGDRLVPKEGGGADSVQVDFSWTFDSAHPEAGISEHETDAAVPPSPHP